MPRKKPIPSTSVLEQLLQDQDWAASDIKSFAASSIKSFGQRYDLSRTTVHFLIARGLLVAHRIGRRTVILRESEEAWKAGLERVPSKGAGGKKGGK